MKETDLFYPVKALCESKGYEVKAEVHEIDVVAKNDDHIIGIELKMQMNIKVIKQALQTLRTCDYAYIGILKPLKVTPTFKDYVFILKRLGVGLILISSKAEIYMDANVIETKKIKKKKLHLLKTFDVLDDTDNIGGMHHHKKMTLYKKQALEIATCLLNGPKKVSTIKEETNILKTQSILYKNYYGWFESHKKGMYQLTTLGQAVMNTNK